MYYVYIVRCADNTFYTGITNDLEKRIENHNTSKTGAKYTRTRRPVELIYKVAYENQSLAKKREAEIKNLTRAQKTKLIAQGR